MNNNSEHLTPVRGYKYISTVLMIQLVDYGNNKDKTIDQLVLDVYYFDRSYMYSDSGSVYNSWANIEKKLMARIVNSEFSKELKDSLTKGLELHGRDQLVRNFPELHAYCNYSIKALFNHINNLTYSELLIDKYIDIENRLGTLIEKAYFGKADTYLVHTPKADKFTRKDLEDYPKLKLSESLNSELQSILNEIDIDELELVTKFKRLLGTYIDLGTPPNSNIKLATLVPDTKVSMHYSNYRLIAHCNNIDMGFIMFI